MFGFLKKILGGAGGGLGGASMPAAGTLGLDELARRLKVSPAELNSISISYTKFQINKRSGGTRTILAPAAPLKAIQRTILHRLLRRLKAQPCVTGFERGHSIVTNALPHVGQDVILKLDIKDFFPSIRAKRVEALFRKIGWNAEAAARLTELCTQEGSLPQGAPTSPRLANLVNHRLDARLSAVAEKRGVNYSRYADDMTFSGPAEPQGKRINDLIVAVKTIVENEGYALHTKKKLRIARRHNRQVVTGLVVNQKINLPRATRRRLRAIEHRLRTKGQATLTAAQLAGWKSLQQMIAAQSAAQ